MVAWFLLHNAPNVGIGGVSGERQVQHWGMGVGAVLPQQGGVLHFGMSFVPCRSTPMSPPPFRRSV
jgi:hypothetical protein